MSERLQKLISWLHGCSLSVQRNAAPTHDVPQAESLSILCVARPPSCQASLTKTVRKNFWGYRASAMAGELRQYGKNKTQQVTLS